MVEKMGRLGIGPVYAALSLVYGLASLWISHHFNPLFRIGFLPERLLNGLGAFLILVGVPFWIIAVVTVMRAYEKDELVTTGVFGCCRHPVYAAWTVFIVPGIMLFAKSWLALTTPLFMYVVLHFTAEREEEHLSSYFGGEYGAYKKRVPRILPTGCLKLRRHG